MKKTFAVFALVLLVAFAVVGVSASGPASASSFPIIIGKIALTNQTAAIAPTTVFTPVQDGLFRMSVYMTQTPPTSSTDYWFFNANWTDDAGAELAHQACALPTTVTPPNAYVGEVGGNPGCVLVFRAKAGIPITYSTVEGFSGSGGAYSIYLALERLM